MTRRTRASSGLGPGFSEAPDSGCLPRPQIPWTARRDRSMSQSFWFTALSRFRLGPQGLDRPLQFANVLKTELSCFGKLRHHGLRAAAEEAEDLIEQAVPRNVACDQRLEDVGIPNFSDTTDGLLGLQPVYGRLDRGVCRPG